MKVVDRRGGMQESTLITLKAIYGTETVLYSKSSISILASLTVERYTRRRIHSQEVTA